MIGEPEDLFCWDEELRELELVLTIGFMGQPGFGRSCNNQRSGSIS